MDARSVHLIKEFPEVEEAATEEGGVCGYCSFEKYVFVKMAIKSTCMPWISKWL